MVPRKPDAEKMERGVFKKSDMFVMVDFADVKANVDEANLLDKERPVLGVGRIEATTVIKAQAQRPVF